MEKFILSTGKTIDLAIENALKELQMDRDSVSVEVLEYPKSGFLGIGAAPAKIKVTYEAPDEEVKPAPALSGASRSKPKKYEPKTEPLKPLNPLPPKAPKAEAPKAEAPKAEAPKAEAPKAERKNEQPRKSRPAKQPRPAAAPVEKEYEAAAPGSVEERIEIFIKGLLEHMGSDAVPHAWKSKDSSTYQVDLVGEHLGMLIGRRGETLDAIQHLTNYAINRDSNKRTRINVDAENYRLKREDSLRHLAKKVAGKVVRYHRNITLEPMNAYERHVIHATLQDVPDVTTFSTGTEPNRRVVVSYTKYPEE